MRTRIVRGIGAAVGLWVVETWTNRGWRQAALPVRTREMARELAAVVGAFGPTIGREV